MSLSIINNTQAQPANPGEQARAWRNVISALIGTWGTGPWGTDGWYARRSDLWEGKRVLTVAIGPVVTDLPWPANNSVITIVPVGAPAATQTVLAVSGDSFTWTATTAGQHILVVGPTQMTRG